MAIGFGARDSSRISEHDLVMHSCPGDRAELAAARCVPRSARLRSADKTNAVEAWKRGDEDAEAKSSPSLQVQGQGPDDVGEEP